MTINKKYSLIVFLIGTILFACSDYKTDRQNPIEERATDPKAIADEMRSEMSDNLSKWYPLSIDTVNHGFLENIDYKWELLKEQPKFAVAQSRHIYTCSQSYSFYKEEKYKEYATNGFKFLNEKMWDNEFGGFFTFVSQEGSPIFHDNRHLKLAYSQAFGIYGAVNYFFISKDSAALDLAINAFHWLEKNSYDNENGGYFQFLSREGAPMEKGFGDPPKDQNSSIHLLEAFTDLYKVWKDDLLRKRLEEILIIIRDTIVTKEGYLQLFFRRDWSPVYYNDDEYKSDYGKYHYDHISFGHDVETGFLMIESSEALGLEHDVRTHEIAKKMIDHAINFGFDEHVGGLYDGGYYMEEDVVTIVNDSKAWWSQVEALNSFLIMHELYPSDKINYFDYFTYTWEYCKNYLIDPQHGGWFRSGLDKEPEAAQFQKGGPWTVNYHIVRSMINSINRIEKTIQY